jgi:hypothetical protein
MHFSWRDGGGTQEREAAPSTGRKCAAWKVSECKAHVNVGKRANGRWVVGACILAHNGHEVKANADLMALRDVPADIKEHAMALAEAGIEKHKIMRVLSKYAGQRRITQDAMTAIMAWCQRTITPRAADEATELLQWITKENVND